MSANGTPTATRIKVRLTNDFHGSEAVVIGTPAADQSNEYGDPLAAGTVRVEITERQAGRAARKLCGIRECSCGRHGPRLDTYDNGFVAVVAERVVR